VLINQELIVGAVYRVVQHGAVQTDLDVLHRAKRPVKHKRVADLGGHGITDTLFFATLRDIRPV
jgi:hypothetical protein